MNLKKRLESLEAISTEVMTSRSDVEDELKRELIRIAERARNVSLDNVLQDPSPITAYAMLCDGRVNERLVELIDKYAEYPDPVGRLFKHTLEMANAA